MSRALFWMLNRPVSEQEISRILGTTSDPQDGGSSLGSTSTWIMPQSRTFEQTLRQFKIYCSVGGTVKLKLIVPNAGGFTVTDIQTLTCSSGLNTFTVDGATLNETTIPANSFLAIKPGTATVRFLSDSPAFHMGYLVMSGDALGSNVVTSSISYLSRLEMQYTANGRRGGSQYIIDEDCSGSVLPALAINNGTNPWTFSAGKLTNASTGLASFLDWYPTSNGNYITFSVEFEFKAAGDRFAVYRKPFINDAGALTGSIVEADLNNNKIVVYESWNGGTTYTLPSVESELTLTSLTLATAVRYKLEIIKNGKLISARIIRVSDSVSETLTVDNDTTKVSGLGYGRFGIAAIAGTIDVYGVQAYANKFNIKTLVLGDSIVEGSGATDNDTEGFAALVVANTDAVYSGDGGTKLLNILKRLRHELRIFAPKYVVIESVNNCVTDQEVTDYANQIPLVYQEIVNSGATPIFCMPTPNSNATQNARLDTNRAFLLATGYNVARTDIALSVGGDGSTYDASLMTDGVHPNTAGHLAFYNRLVSDFPEIL